MQSNLPQKINLQKKSSQINKWVSYKSWLYPRNLLKSIPSMNQQQLYLNLVEINLCAYYNPDVLQVINKKMTQTSFYLRNRHLLQNLINTYNRQKGLNDKIGEICKRFDQIYVNGLQKQVNGDNSNKNKRIKVQQNKIINMQTKSVCQTQTTTQQKQQIHLQQVKLKQLNGQQQQQQQMKQKLQNDLSLQQIDKKNKKKQLKITKDKHYKAKFLSRRQDFILALSQISQKLFNCQQGKTQDQIYFNKQKLFVQQIIQLNNKIDSQSQIKSTSSVDSSSQIDQPQKNIYQPQQNINQIQKLQFINFKHTRGYSFYYKNQYQQVNSILLDNSTFIKTKNRTPLQLDFGFSKFIYKNDDQLAHQIIAMQLIKYLNKIFGKQFIKQYQIIPQIKGALYQFIQNSKTIANIKSQHKDLPQYLKYLVQNKNIQINSFQKKFAQSYAGYCISQFLLQIKDRNNSNLMLKQDGTFFHIDLAFIFNAKPGGISFQSAPFKMTKQYVKLMGGFDSDNFKYFQSLLIQLITRLYESRDEYLYKLQIVSSRSKQIRCFNGFNMKDYKQNKIIKSLDKIRDFVQDLIDKSYDSWCTKKYDTYQWKTNKIPV